MKIAIVYNRESQAVINLFGTPNQEKYGLETIKRIKDGLQTLGHQVQTFEGDKNIIQKLEEYMPSVISGERPGLVFNLSYGIQGKGRYMHVPGILEMIGVPYVGSGPETHAMALDKVVTKMILLQKGLPTPRFAELEKPDSPITAELSYPLIVKPKNEAVSFGLKIVNNEEELREGVKTIYDNFHSSTLVEEYIEGREVNVGLLGNSPVQALPVVELTFGDGPQIFTYEDKTSSQGDRVKKLCPAPLGDELTAKVQKLAIDTFHALNCFDTARVDFRIDKEGNPYILEVNSMASLGSGGSFVFAAESLGMSYAELMNRIVEVTSERYFGPQFVVSADESGEKKGMDLFEAITKNRSGLEKDLKMWTNMSSRTEDPVGLSAVRKKIEERFTKLGLQMNKNFSNGRSAWTWETKKGFKDGTLLVVPMDVPGNRTGYPVPYRTEQEWIYGEGVASSRGGLTTMFHALTALKDTKKLSSRKIGVFFYSDEGRGMRYSTAAFEQAVEQAGEVIVLQPGFTEGKIVDQRRGFKQFNVIVEGDPVRVGKSTRDPDVLSYFVKRADELQSLSNRRKKLAVAVQDVKSERYSVLMPHRVVATFSVTYIDPELARDAEIKLREAFNSNGTSIRTYVEEIVDRKPMSRKKNHPLRDHLHDLSEAWNIPFGTESSLLPSAAGIVPKDIPAICGFAPASKDLFTPNEALHRRELAQRTLLLALHLEGE